MYIVNTRIYADRNGVFAKRHFHNCLIACLFWHAAIQFLRTILYEPKDYIRFLAIFQINNNIKYILQYHRFIMAVVQHVHSLHDSLTIRLDKIQIVRLPELMRLTFNSLSLFNIYPIYFILIVTIPLFLSSFIK